MIYEIKINRLTNQQKSNLMKGKGVRVHGGDFPIPVDKNNIPNFIITCD